MKVLTADISKKKSTLHHDGHRIDNTLSPCTAGYKFEELSTLQKWWDDSTRQEIETRNENIVDNIQQYCSIVKTQLGSSSIIMGGEVDCLWGILFYVSG